MSDTVGDDWETSVAVEEVTTRARSTSGVDVSEAMKDARIDRQTVHRDMVAIGWDQTGTSDAVYLGTIVNEKVT